MRTREQSGSILGMNTCLPRTISGLGMIGIASLFLVAGCGAGSVGGAGSGNRLATPALAEKINEADCSFQYTLQPLVATAGLDPLLSEQWYLENTGKPIGNAPATTGEDLRVIPVWATNKGEGVRVAVVDDAVEIIHPDLAPNVVPFSSFNYRLSSPFAYYPLPCSNARYAGIPIAAIDDHGTAVAGIIAARDGNGVGTAGVAPRVELVAYNALSTETDADIADALTRDLAKNSILHNSWGSADDGKLHSADNSFIAAINKGLTTGRNGKGTIFVFPAGNGGCYITNPDRSCKFEENSNFDGYVNRLGQITVCSVGPNGRYPVYAEPGANILVCAPTYQISTTDVGGKWRSDFNGTSASAPMISGVVALMLKENPNLTWRDVKLILARSARQNHATEPGWTTAYGLNFNPYYGFGVPDATKAVALAKTWSSVGNSSSLKSCGPYAKTVEVALPDGGSANRIKTDSVAIDANCAISKIEFIEVTFTAAHQYSGDLEVSLLSPNGLVSTLAQRRACDGAEDACRPYDNWQFGSVRHLEEPSNGVWTLRVSDEAPRDTGNWKNWSIKFYGR
jgi:proprotein convertase subtilisin/kexin type 2